MLGAKGRRELTVGSVEDLVSHTDARKGGLQGRYLVTLVLEAGGPPSLVSSAWRLSPCRLGKPIALREKCVVRVNRFLCTLVVVCSCMGETRVATSVSFCTCLFTTAPTPHQAVAKVWIAWAQRWPHISLFQ